MLIHRVAHPLLRDPQTGRAVGPYNASRMLDFLNNSARSEIEGLVTRAEDAACANGEFHTPTPNFDGIRGFRPGVHQAAFASVEQAAEWFRFGVMHMREAGFQWFTYDISKRYVIQGNKQVVARLSRARLVSIEPIPFDDDPDYVSPNWCYECDDFEMRCMCINESDFCPTCELEWWICSCTY